jgi:hypothetical protein
VGWVAPGCHVKSGKAFYSVLWQLMGQQVSVRTAGDVVQIFCNDTVVATHVLHQSGRSTIGSTADTLSAASAPAQS